MDRRIAGRKSRWTDRDEELKQTVLLASLAERETSMGSAYRSILGALMALAMVLAGPPALAQKQYGPGVTDSEIKIGNTTPYSGPASAYSAGAVSIAAYFAMINDQGGVNGRKINFISLDDAYSPPKTVEQIRRLVESDEVSFLLNPVGTATNMAVVRYLNQKKVPHLFIGSGATIFNEPDHYPWSMSWTPHYASEGEIYAKYILSVKPDAKIAILSQNDDLGRDYLLGFRRGLGDKASSMIVASSTYNASDPTVDSQVVSLRASGADVFLIVTVPKFSAQAIRKAYDIDWHPLKFLISVGSSIAGAIRPAGFEASRGIISAAYQKDPGDPQWKNDPAMQAWNVWMDKYNPHVDKSDYYAPYGYNIGFAVVQILKQCGEDLTRENIMKQASHLDMELPLLLPGIRLKTTPADLRPIRQMRLVRFDGERYVLFSDVLASE
jgi:branched-chain amino acid transport system substrate-binding protein